MNYYNLAVTIGPNIFRPKLVSGNDITKAAIHYELLIRMMENFDVYFDQKITLQELIEHPANNFDLE